MEALAVVARMDALLKGGELIAALSELESLRQSQPENTLDMTIDVTESPKMAVAVVESRFGTSATMQLNINGTVYKREFKIDVNRKDINRQQAQECMTAILKDACSDLFNRIPEKLKIWNQYFR